MSQVTLDFQSLGADFTAFVADPTSETGSQWCEKNGIKVSHTPSINGNNYHIVRYDKSRYGSNEGQLTMNDSIRLLRSIIISNGEIVCVSLPKSSGTIDNADGVKGGGGWSYVSYMEEGPMVNVFYMSNDSRIKSVEDKEQFGWQISTRSVFGAKNSYFDDDNGNKVTFRQMFLEAMPNNLFDSLDRNCCYSFVVRHPKNRDVFKVDKPHLLHVATFSKVNSNSLEWRLCDNIDDLPDGVVNPEAVCDSVLKSDFLGTTLITNVDGQLRRWKTINEEYKNLRKLRGTQPKLLFHYLALRKQKGAIGKYLNSYPEHSVIFSGYRERIHSFTNELGKNYFNCYVLHSAPLASFDGKYKQHMYNLHTQYKETRRNINSNAVITYVNSLAPAQLMYVLNWERHASRHNNKTNIKQNSEDNMMSN